MPEHFAADDRIRNAWRVAVAGRGLSHSAREVWCALDLRSVGLATLARAVVRSAQRERRTAGLGARRKLGRSIRARGHAEKKQGARLHGVVSRVDVEPDFHPAFFG